MSKVVDPLTVTQKPSSAANTPPLYNDGELSDPPELSVTSHPDVVPSAGDGALWEDWLKHHRVTEPVIENKTDVGRVFLREEKVNPVTVEDKPAGNNTNFFNEWNLMMGWLDYGFKPGKVEMLIYSLCQYNSILLIKKIYACPVLAGRAQLKP